MKRCFLIKSFLITARRNTKTKTAIKPIKIAFATKLFYLQYLQLYYIYINTYIIYISCRCGFEVYLVECIDFCGWGNWALLYQ